jgi:plastocyanin
MKGNSYLNRTRTAILVAGLLMAAGWKESPAVTHVIQFGGSFGSTYSPADLTCSVGDTIRWQGTFSSHPLTSTSVPAGAASWHAGSGAVFSYPVTVAGTYHYKCDFHAGSGMIGQFTANAATGVSDDPAPESPGGYSLEPAYPNPFNAETTVRFILPESRNIRVAVYDASGREAAVLFDGPAHSGTHEVRFDGSALASGVYVVRLQAGGFTGMKRVTLVK